MLAYPGYIPVADTFRHGFPAAVIQKCGERVAHICSNPTCRSPTIGPHSDPAKSLKTGEACHIRAASPGGPRFDESQTKEERTSIQNAIWLCSKCATLIDKDPIAHAVERLIEWKSEQEEWLRNGGFVPRLPEITMKTRTGLTVSPPGEIVFSADDDRREHTFRIANIANSPLLSIAVRVQLPEPVLEEAELHVPAGVNIVWTGDRSQMMASGTPGSSVTVPLLPTSIYRLEVDRLPAQQHIEIGIRTSLAVRRGPDFDEGMWADRSGERPNLYYHVTGTFQFEYQSATLSRTMMAPLIYDKATRKMSIGQVKEELPEFSVMIMSGFGL